MANLSEYERWSQYQRWIGWSVLAFAALVIFTVISLIVPPNTFIRGWQAGLACCLILVGWIKGPRALIWLTETLHSHVRHRRWGRWSGKYYAFDDIQIVIEPMGKGWQVHHGGVFTIMGLKADAQTHRRVELVCGELDYFRDDEGEWWFTDAGLSAWLQARTDQLNHLTRRFAAWWERDTLPLLRKQAGIAPPPRFAAVLGSPLPMAATGNAGTQATQRPQPATPVTGVAILSDDILATIDRCVLCWLATVDAEGMPNASPKEIFVPDGCDAILVANIASPTTVRNLLGNARVCVSFIDVFVQKGYKLLGTAEVIPAGTARYDALVPPLAAMTGGKFRIHHVLRIQVARAEPIMAPSYRLKPDVTEAEQVAAAMRAYGVVPRSGDGTA
jgi:predicted pyridoxine 5'-phosphate oxidase superfamily flavin-nucleotide-binding protein